MESHNCKISIAKGDKGPDLKKAADEWLNSGFKPPFKVEKSVAESDLEFAGEAVKAHKKMISAPFFNQTLSYFVQFDGDPDETIWRISYSGNVPFYDDNFDVAIDSILTVGL